MTKYMIVTKAEVLGPSLYHVRNKIRGSRANYKLLLVGFFLKEPTQAG